MSFNNVKKKKCLLIVCLKINIFLKIDQIKKLNNSFQLAQGVLLTGHMVTSIFFQQAAKIINYKEDVFHLGAVS